MTRCERCDRPKLWTCPDGLDDCRCDERYPDHCRKGEDCDANAVDWRARTLAAEAELDALICGDHGVSREFNALAVLDLYQQRADDAEAASDAAMFAMLEAQDIARRALVVGLAECDLQRWRADLAEQNYSEALAALDEAETCISELTDILEMRAAHAGAASPEEEQAIRADERAKVAAERAAMTKLVRLSEEMGLYDDEHAKGGG